MSTSKTHGNAILTAFLQRFLDDQAAGKVQPLEAYQGLYPGFEDLIAQEYRGLVSAMDPERPPPEESDGARCIGSYRISRRLGQGGFGTVYLAEDTRLGRKVALKVLQAFGADAEVALQRFRREAETASKLDDPAICTVYETGIASGVPFIAMRYVEGSTLADLIARARDAASSSDTARDPKTAPDAATTDERGQKSAGPSSRRDVHQLLALAERVARALHVAHEARIIHRDVKPGNIMVTPAGEPVILDFGLARELEDDDLTRSFELLGTFAYMAPEQIERKVPLDRRIDVYALGATLFEALTLRRPFTGPSVDALLQAIRTRPPPDPRRLNPSVSRDLKVVLETALEKDRDRRYATALDFAEDLRRVRLYEPIAARPAGLALRLSRWAQRKPSVAALVLLGGLVLPGLAGYLIASLPAIEAGREQERRERVDALVEKGFLRLACLGGEEALPHFEEALASDPDSLEALSGKIMALTWLHRAEEALATIDARPELLASLPALQGLRSDALEVLGRPAERTPREVSAGSPDPALDAFVAGFRARRIGTLGGDAAELDRALDLFTRAIVLARTARPIYHMFRAQAAGHCADLAAAAESADALITLWPHSAAAHFFAGLGLHGAGDVQGALAHYREAARIEPDFALFRSTLGAIYAGLGDFEAGLAEYRAALALDPEDLTTNVQIGMSLEDAGRFEEAAVHLHKVIAKDPTWIEARVKLVRSLRESGDLAGALAEARQGVQLSSDDPRAYESLARTLERAGEDDEALRIAEEGLALALKDPDRFAEAGRSLRALVRDLKD